MRVPVLCRPRTTHLMGGDCPCGHRHKISRPVIRGPRGRLTGWWIGYAITDDRLYQQVRIQRPAPFPPGIASFQVVRTVGTIEHNDGGVVLG